MEVSFYAYHPSRNHIQMQVARKSLDIYCVHVKERADSVPAGEEPVEWRLLTSHEVSSLAQAVQMYRLV